MLVTVKGFLGIACAALVATPVYAQDFVFDFKQPKNGATQETESDIVEDDVSREINENLPPAQIVFADGYSANSPEMQGWTNDPMDAQLYYYGVVAASGLDYGWWADNFHNIEDARAHVLEWCNMDVPESEKPCEIVAEIIPHDSIVDLVEGISADGYLGYTEYLAEGRSKAFAISPNGAWGYAFNYDNPFEATAEAIATCNEYAANETTPSTIDNQCSIIDRNGTGIVLE